jgi:predicted aspartyl protease
MPSLTVALDHAGRPIIELYVGVASAEQDTPDPHEPTPPPVRVRALLDTGASMTVVERRFLEGLGAEPSGTIQLHSSTTGGEPVPALLYAASLALAGDVTGVLAADLEVLAVEDLGGLGIQALPGRDVLNLSLLNYDGPGRAFALTFPPFEKP